MAIGGSEHGAEIGQERTDRVFPGWGGWAGPHVAPTAVELIGQHGDDSWSRHVLVQHLDAGTVPSLVDVAEHRSCHVAILRRRWAFRHRQLEADRKVQFLGVSGTNPLSSTFEL